MTILDFDSHSDDHFESRFSGNGLYCQISFGRATGSTAMSVVRCKKGNDDMKLQSMEAQRDRAGVRRHRFAWSLLYCYHGVATISWLLKMIGLFCRISSL